MHQELLLVNILKFIKKILKKRKTSLFVLFEVLPTGLLQNIYELWLVHDLNELIVC